MGTDYVVAWPNAEIGFMSADNAAQVTHFEQLSDLHRAFAPWTAATQSLIHNVIRPEETRQAVIDGLFIGRGYR